MNVEKWTALKDKTAELSVRERAIIASTGVVLVFIVWLQIFYSDIESAQKKYKQQERAILDITLTQSERLSELTVLLAHDPNASLRTQQKKLNEDLLTIRQQIEGRLSHLIAPEKMADIMRQVLSDYKGLSLVSAKNLPVEPLKINPEKKPLGGKKQSMDISLSQADSQAVIFAHGFEMVLAGNYFQTLEFLQHLETMSGFYWQALSYEVETYPKAKITLHLSTLSLEEDWIGV